MIFTLTVLTTILFNLKAVETSRSILHKTVALQIGKPSMQYVLRNDDFQSRKVNIIFASVVIILLLMGIMLLFYLLDKTYWQLKHAEQSRSEMISVISHNAKHYLTVIKGRVDLLLMKLEAGIRVNNLSRDLNMLRENTISLNYLIDNLKNNELLSQGKVAVFPAIVDLPKIIRKTLGHLQELITARKISAEFSAAESTFYVSADIRLAEQIIMNLIHNAVKFTREGGEVKIKMCRQDGRIKTYIHDQGPGIAPENWEEIFIPFTRLHPGLPGTGLGLSNSRQFIELLGGKLGIAESQPGAGTIFYFELVAADPETISDKEMSA